MQAPASSAQAPAIAPARLPVVSCIVLSKTSVLHMPFYMCIGEMLLEPQLQADTMTPAEEDLVASWLTADDDFKDAGKNL